MQMPGHVFFTLAVPPSAPTSLSYELHAVFHGPNGEENKPIGKIVDTLEVPAGDRYEGVSFVQELGRVTLNAYGYYGLELVIGGERVAERTFRVYRLS